MRHCKLTRELITSVLPSRFALLFTTAFLFPTFGCGRPPSANDPPNDNIAKDVAESDSIEIHVKPLPKSDNSLLLRTDFSDDVAWNTLRDAVQVPSEEGFQARFEFVDDPAYDDLTIEQLVKLSPKDGDHSFVCIADRFALTNLEQPVLVVDLYHEPGRTFRVIPREIWGVENNLSIANMDFHEFADRCDSDGVFRGFPTH